MSEQRDSGPIDALLVVEDSPANMTVLSALLKPYGFHIFQAEDGEKALEILDNPGEKNIVAILSDLIMPHVDGLELLTHVRMHDHFRNIPFIIISATLDGDEVMHAMQMGIKDYLLKPVTAEGVREKMWQLFPHLQEKNSA